MTTAEKLVLIAENQQKVYDAGFTAGSGGNGVPIATGTATSNNDTVITFPQLDFTPKLITVWNLERVDNGDDVPYLYSGFMLMAMYINDEWVSQGIGAASGETYITNASATRGNGNEYPNAPSSNISINNGIYSCQLSLAGPLNEEFGGGGFSQNLANITVNYAIYG